MSHSQMPNVTIERYPSPLAGFLGCVAPVSRDWILFVADDGSPSLFTRLRSESANGDTSAEYVGQAPADAQPLDFVVRPSEVHAASGGKGMGYTAELVGGPRIAGDGESEHEAIRRLLNYVAEVAHLR